jgi:K(+)-stimulated pyrophosphate-energized sodium pump
MGGSIDDFGGMDLFYYQWLLQVWNLIFIIGTLLVKITDDNAKESTSSKALNIGNWVSIGLTAIACYFLVQYMLSNYEDGIFGEGSQDISSMRVFYATLIGLFVVELFHQ